MYRKAKIGNLSRRSGRIAIPRQCGIHRDEPWRDFEGDGRELHARLDLGGGNDVDRHVVRRGESLWTIAQKYPNVPIWLLRQYNPDVDFGDVRPRTQLVMPRIESAGTSQASGANPA